jgi:choline dehydrogenase-like flavoprotein
VSSYDVAIVGSGPTGGFAAKVLSEAGLDVLVLEAGKGSLESRAISKADSAKRRLGYRIEEDPAAVRRQRMQSHCYAWPTDPHAFVDDLDNPCTTAPGQPFAWLRCRRIGGRMTVRRHGLQFYRFSDLDFKAGERDGASASWPISLADLAPYYERIERWMRIRGTRNGLPQLPDSTLAEETPPGPAVQALTSALRKDWTDRQAIACRTAAPPLPIRDALETGRCTLRPNAIVSQVLTERATGRASGVRYIDRWTHREHIVRARVVVLCASSIESARLLLASATPQHPAGLGNSSGVLGRYLMDHLHLGGINADMPIDETQWREAGWSYIPRFRNVVNNVDDFVRGYGLQVFTEGNQCALTAFGEMLPHPDNRVTLDRDVKDKWGVPAARIACVVRENDAAMMRDAAAEACAMMTAAGFKIWRFNTHLSMPGTAIHEVGTARMSADPRTGVLNSFCQSWDMKTLFVMDGSCFVTQGVQNPTLTMLALAARSCDYLLEAMRTGDL